MTVVVGISRRTGSLDALRWAIAEAKLRGTNVLGVTAWRPPRPPAAPGARPPAVAATPAEVAHDDEQARIVGMLEGYLGSPLAAHGVDYRLVKGSPASVLLAAAAGAELLVLDSPRSGNLSTVPKSWIAPTVVFRAPCPVVVMPRVEA